MALKIEIVAAKNGYVVILNDTTEPVEPFITVAKSIDDALKVVRDTLNENADDIPVPKPPSKNVVDDDGAEAV